MMNAHSHTCPNRKCGFQWQHTPGETFADSFLDNIKAHTCPVCGKEQYWKDDITNYDAPENPPYPVSDAPDKSILQAIKDYAKTQKRKLSRKVRTPAF